MYETIRHLHQHHGNEYDWFYLAQDDTYTQAERVMELVNHLSAGQDMYMGRAEELSGVKNVPGIAMVDMGICCHVAC